LRGWRTDLKQPQPLIVVDLFPEVLEHLLELLSDLSAEDWEKPTACSLWSVKDVALHLLGDEVGNLSRRRDGHTLSGNVEGWDDLVNLINEWNEMWVDATQRISPRLLCDLLKFTGTQMCDYFRTLDPYSMGGPVSWAGPDPAPVWLDLAREYTERWLHQQHIRDAVARSGLKQPRFFAPVLDTFVRALPHTYRETDAADGTLVALTISGESGGQWSLLREKGLWNLYLGISHQPDAEVVIDEDVAWRIFTKGLGKEEAQVTVVGDQVLGLKVLDTVSIIA
jgi:uncharacterized protein (TIGR03083 family)